MNQPGKTGKADALTEAIRPRLLAIWAHYQSQEAEAHNALLADDYQAVGPDGGLRSGKPTPQEIAKAPLSAFTLVQVRAIPLGLDAALMTYTAEVDGEVWVRRAGEWKCRYYQGTPVTK